jgi:hypothetical protein
MGIGVGVYLGLGLIIDWINYIEKGVLIKKKVWVRVTSV